MFNNLREKFRKSRFYRIIKSKEFFVFTVATLFFYLLVFFLYKDTILLWCDDCFTQSYRFLEEMNAKKNIFSWDWYSFLGSSYLTTNSFYYGTNIIVKYVLSFFTTILGPYSFYFFNFVWMILLGLTTMMWLSCWADDKKAILVSTLIIVFGGWTLAYFKYHFLSVIWLIPLLTLSIDDFIDSDKYISLTLLTAFTGFTNYYCLIIFIPYLFLYTLFVFFYKNKFISIKSTIIKAAKFFLFFIIGIGISSIIFIPSIYQIIQAPSRGVKVNLLYTINLKDAFSLITSFLSPISAVNEHNYFISSNYSNMTYGGGVGLFSLMLTLITIPQALKVFDKNKIKKMFILYIFLILLTILKGIYPLLNANWDARWMYMYNFFNAFFVVQILDHRQNFSKSLLYITSIVITVAIIICLAISYKHNFYPSLTQFKILVFEELIFVIILFIYCVILKKNTFYLLSLLEALFSFLLIFSFNNSKAISSALVTKDEFYDDIIKKQNIINYIKNKDDSSFYRIDEFGKDSPTSNLGISNEYMSFTFYSSLYNYNLENFANARFKGYGQWHFLENKGLQNLKTMLGAKYYIDYTNSSIPPYGYIYFGTCEDTNIYLNQNYLSIAYGMDNELNIDVYNKQNLFDKNRILLNYVILNDSPNNNFEFINNPEALAENCLYEYSLDTNNLKNGILYYVEDSEYSYLINRYYLILNNGNIIENKQLFTDFPIEISMPETSTEIISSIDSTDLLGYNISYSIFYDDMNWYNEWISNLKDEQLTNIAITGNSLSGDIVLNDDKWILTSIGFDKGWKAYIDGVETEIYNANEGLIAIKGIKGHHQISLKYTPYLLNESIVASALFSIIFILINIVTRKKINK